MEKGMRGQQYNAITSLECALLSRAPFHPFARANEISLLIPRPSIRPSS